MSGRWRVGDVQGQAERVFEQTADYVVHHVVLARAIGVGCFGKVVWGFKARVCIDL